MYSRHITVGRLGYKLANIGSLENVPLPSFCKTPKMYKYIKLTSVSSVN